MCRMSGSPTKALEEGRMGYHVRKNNWDLFVFFQSA